MPQKTKNGDLEPRPVPSWVWILLFALAVGAYFAGLGMPLVGPDEPRYAQVAREMFERGDLVTPTLGGYHWFEKPALLYWLQIASYSLFGVGEFAARLGSALFGLGTAASLWVVGSVTIHEGERLEFLGRWLGLISASTLGLLVFAHGASFDIIVTFPMTAALVSFFIFDQSDSDGFKDSTLPLLLFYFFVGISLLAKGLIGIVFPFAIIGLYHLVSWKMPHRRLIISFFSGTLIAMATAATWYLPMYLRHGYEFIDEFFLQHHFQRFTSNKYQHPQPFYFFFWILPLMTLPWLPFFGAAIVNQIRRLIGKNGEGTTRSVPDLLRLAWAWLLVPLVFFSLSGSKLPGYILPAVPAAVIISGLYIHRLVARSFAWRNIVLGFAGLTLTVLITVAFTVSPRFANEESVKSLIAAADARGYSSKTVLMFLRISHNAEFYASGRLVRDEEGKLDRIPSKDELLRELRSLGGTAIVLVPREYASQLTDAPEFGVEMLGNNEEFDIAVVTARN
jgi:4-amino-4-deoxy-L-arabinose transferase-like glycosyltransferase